MHYINRINELLEQKKISTNKMLMDCHVSTSAMDIWKKGKAKPSLDALTKIADYFEVSIDYLIGRAEPQTVPPEFAKKFCAAPKRVQDLTSKYLDDLTDMHEQIGKQQKEVQ